MFWRASRKWLDEKKDVGPDEADPYVLALALGLKGEGRDVRVVTQERKSVVRKMSLASAAGYLGLPAVDVRTMLKFEGILDFGPV